MKKLATTLTLCASFAFSNAALAHPGCPDIEFWGKSTENCEEHQHEEVTLVGAEEKHIIYFAFDSAVVGDIQDIKDYIDSLKQLDKITLVGHADRLGTNNYNQKLSQRRVNAVADKLIYNGIEEGKIFTDYKGEEIPAQSCEGERSPELIECLYANRRVEIEIVGEKVLQQADHH